MATSFWWNYGGLRPDTQDAAIAQLAMLTQAVWTSGQPVRTLHSQGGSTLPFNEIVCQITKGYRPILLRLAENPLPAPNPYPQGRVKVAYPAIFNTSRHYLGVSEHGAISVSERGREDAPEWQIDLYTTNESEVARVEEWCLQNLTPVNSLGLVRSLTRPKPTDPIRLISLGKIKSEYEPRNYSARVQQQFDALIQDLNSPSPRGRMSILHGPPGTGKTFLLKALTKRCPQAAVVFVPNNLVSDLGSPEMISMLAEISSEHGTEKVILLCEDADMIFRERDKENTSAISSALNLTDGLVGEVMQVFVVGTTNVTLDKIDPAIKRPGRLAHNIHIGPLTPEESAAVIDRLGGKIEVPKEMTLAEVYQYVWERAQDEVQSP